MKHRNLILGVGAATVAAVGAVWYGRKHRHRGRGSTPVTSGDLRNALTSQRGNVAAAARKLGISEKYAHDMLGAYPAIREEARRLRIATTGKDIGRPPWKHRQ